MVDGVVGRHPQLPPSSAIFSPFSLVILIGSPTRWRLLTPLKLKNLCALLLTLGPIQQLLYCRRQQQQKLGIVEIK
jgi:hypothetical protein